MYYNRFIISVLAACIPAWGFAATVPGCPAAPLQKNLRMGSRGADVTVLQTFLKTTQPSLLTTGTYGKMTRDALAQFQKKNATDITKSGVFTAGAFDLPTRTFLNTYCTETKSVTVTQPHLQVTAAQIQPKSIPGGALRIPFTTVHVRAVGAPVSISSITVARTGLGNDGAFESVVLLDEAGEVQSDERILNSMHTAVIPFDLTLEADESATITVAANIGELDDYGGQMPTFTIQSIATTTEIRGLPITGTAHTLVSGLTIGSMGFGRSVDDPAFNKTLYINDRNTIFSGIRIVSGSAEPLLLTGIAWEQNGSAGISDIANVTVEVNGQSFPTEAEGREYTATFGDGIRIEKGMSVSALIKGDITGSGSGRTVRFDLAGPDDVTARGLTYGFFVEGSPESHTDTSGNAVFLTSDGTTDGESLNPFYKGSEFIISPGSFNSITK